MFQNLTTRITYNKGYVKQRIFDDNLAILIEKKTFLWLKESDKAIARLSIYFKFRDITPLICTRTTKYG